MCGDMGLSILLFFVQKFSPDFIFLSTVASLLAKAANTGLEKANTARSDQ